MRVEIGYDSARGTVTGHCVVGVDERGRPIAINVSESGVHELAKAIAARMLRAERRRYAGDEIGFFGFVKKAWNKIKGTATKIAKKVKVYGVLKKVAGAAKKVVSTAKKIYESPAFAAAVGVVSAAVPGGAAIAAGYAGTRAALALFDKVRKGDPAALQTVGGYAAKAMAGTPEGQKAMALMNSVKATTQPVALAANPWLKGLAL